MLRIYLALITLFTGFAMQASHVRGGEIHYNYLGNNNYEFVLSVYRDVTGINLPTIQSLTITGQSTQNVVVTLDTAYALPGCAINTELHRYTGTATVSSIPLTGLTVSWDNCCRSNANDNLVSPGSQGFTFEAKMYPVPGASYASSSPRFYANILDAYAGKNNVLNTAVFDPNPHDSIHVELVSVKGNGTALAYAAGFSAAQPFGGLISSIDPYTGVLTVDGPSIGIYQVGIKASSYRNGQLTGSALRDFPVSVNNPQDSLPTVMVSNLFSTGNVSMANNAMQVEMYPFDSLAFTLVGAVNSLDTLAISGRSLLFGNTAGTSGNCSGPNCATFVAPNGYTGIASVAGNFSFSPDTSIFFPGMQSFVRTVNLVVSKTNSCGATTEVPFTVYITVINPSSIWAVSNTSVCLGSSTQVTINGDTTNLSWMPTTGVSNPTSASPWLSPTSATVYTITNLNDSTQIELTVNVDSIASATLIDNSTWVQLPNFADYDQVVWYYNGLPLAANVDSFAMPWPGDYFALVEKGACSTYSDTVIKVNKNMFPLFGNTGNTVVNTDGFAEFEFKLNGAFGNTLQSLNVALPDSGTYKSGAEPWFLLTDGSQTVVATGTANKVSDGFYSLTGLNLVINPNETYKLFMDVYSGPTIFYAPASFPYTESNGVITILSARYEDSGAQQNDAYPTVVFGMASGIGIEETNLDAVRVYPNPTTSKLIVELEEPAMVELISPLGKVLLKERVEGKTTINMQAFAAGLYILRTERDGHWTQQKVIKN